MIKKIIKEANGGETKYSKAKEKKQLPEKPHNLKGREVGKGLGGGNK